MVEQWPLKPLVLGSSPRRSTITAFLYSEYYRVAIKNGKISFI